ncbi:MAG: pitrilysin family protein, partial [Pseudomonadota bacterium]
MIPIVLGAIALIGVSVAPDEAAVDIQEVTSPGGITAWLVEEPSIPFVALEIRFRGGTSLDAPGKRGAMNLMTGLLEEGAGDLTSRDFATRAEDLSARFSYDVGDDSTSISAEFLNEYRQESLELLRLSIIEPTFPEDAVERVRAQVLSGLESDLKDPNKIAALRFDELAFGAHPYGSAGEGTTDSVKALSRDDLVAAHRGAFSRDKLYVAAVGDITAEDLGEMLDFLFADLPETGADLPERVAFGMEGGVSVVPFDTPQSVVVFGHDGIKRNDPDFFAGYLLLQVLGGGGFNSRLYEEVREKRGLTYGIGAYLAPKDL